MQGVSASKIAVESLSKSFDSISAVDNIDLKIGAGEFVSLVGPSGCGKSTLLYMIGGFVHPTSGRLLADGKPITKPGIDRARAVTTSSSSTYAPRASARSRLRKTVTT